MKFRYKTDTERVIIPTLAMEYQCKKCGYVNQLVLLNPYGMNATYAELHAGFAHESMCHECDDTETITLEFLENDMDKQTKYALMAIGCAVMAGVGIAVILIVLFNFFWRWF